jgi:ribonuclease J
MPIYAARLVAGFIEEKLVEYGIRNIKVNIIDPEAKAVSCGSFVVDAFRVTHSVPDSLGFCIVTPLGKFFHVSDYKFDWTPVDQKPFDIAKAASLARGGVLALAGDSLGATSEGYTKSEAEIEKNIELIMSAAQKAVYFTTISSNISRIQQAINVSEALGRKVVLVGRSIERKVEIARRLGYIHWREDQVILPKEAKKFSPARLTYIISGCYGQVGSALYRVSLDEHEFLKINKGDVVIFSADPAPPGTGQTTNFVVDNLIEFAKRNRDAFSAC